MGVPKRRRAPAAACVAFFAALSGLLAAQQPGQEAVPANPAALGAVPAKPGAKKPVKRFTGPFAFKAGQPIMGLGKLAAPAVIASGQRVFETNCSFCHGADAQGGIGPDLLQSAVVLDDVNGDHISNVVGKGFPGHMPAFNLTPTQLHDLAAFLHSRVLAIANLAHGQYQIPFTVDGNAAAGKAFFYGRGKCSTCHSVSGDLAHIGAKYTPYQLQNLFLTGVNLRTYYGGGSRPKQLVTVKLRSGRSVTGALRYLDDFNVVLVDADGKVESIRRRPGVQVTMNNPLAAHQRLLGVYTDADIHNLTAYLVTLK